MKLVGIALGIVLLIVPSIASARTSPPYVAEGVATLGDDVFLARVEWTGSWWRTFEVTIREPVGAVVVDASVFGQDDSIGFSVANIDLVRTVYRGWSIQPGLFEVHGVQNVVYPYSAQWTQNVLLGTYAAPEGTYQLTLVTVEPLTENV